MSVKAMKSGAVEFLTKPFRDQDLLDAIHQALDRDRVTRQQQSELGELRNRYASLTAREREEIGRASCRESGDRGGGRARKKKENTGASRGDIERARETVVDT